MSKSTPLSIDLVYDTVCPWCYVGKRRLEEALALRNNVEAEINWWPFLLNPGIPEDGMPYELYLSRRFGSVDRARKMNLSVEEAGQTSEIDFAFDNINKTPNSVNSHRLVLYAERFGKGQAAMETLFYAYFVNGKDIGDLEVLGDIGAQLGLERVDLISYLESTEMVEAVYSANRQAHGMGITSVPTFIINKTNVISGGQPAEVIARLIDLSAA
ncbi:MAG: DsbA family oxidoreductase [Rhodospirillales bacterium]|nr:DsbA family oxidoreductase [Rhodospirillales bacterium]